MEQSEILISPITLSDSNKNCSRANRNMEQKQSELLFLTKEYLQNILRTNENCPSLEVLDFVLSKGSEVGDNYLSIMQSVEVKCVVEGKPKTYNLIAKLSSNNPVRKHLNDKLKSFIKESKFYNEIYPALTALLQNNATLTMIPRCYDATEEHLIFEDLRAKGYRMANRRTGLDHEHAVLAIKKLAKLHSLSYCLAGGDRDRLLKLFDGCLHDTAYCSEDSMGADFIDQSVSALVDTVAKMDSLSDHAKGIEELVKREGSPLKLMQNQIERVKDGFAVIGHGDFWVNNMLFLYDSNDRPIDVILIDFQILRAAARAVDLNHAIFSSTSNWETNVDSLLEEYNASFIETLHHCGRGDEAAKFTMENLKEEFENHLPFGLIMASMVLPAMTADETTLFDMESLTQEDMDNFTKGNTENNQFIKMMQGKLYFDRLRDLLIEIRRRGCI